MIKILYLAYNGLTPEIQGLLSLIDDKVFDVTVIVPFEIDLYGQNYRFYSSPKTNKVRYIPFILEIQPYIFFAQPEGNKKLNEVLKQSKPDIIIIQNEFFHPNATAIINAKIKYSPQSKILNFVASQYVISTFQYFKNYLKYRKIVKYTDFLCCRNKMELNRLRKNYLLKGKKVFQNYWGTSPDMFYKIDRKREDIIQDTRRLHKIYPLVKENAIFLGLIGRIVEEKGLHLLIEALRDLPEFYYLIYAGQLGNSDYERRINVFIQKDNLSHRCHYCENIPYLELVYLYNIIDILVVPTYQGEINFIELFGRVIVEAMLCKTLVIGSNNGSIPEIVHNENMIFQQGNSQSLKKKIIALEGLDETEKNTIIEDNYSYALNNYTNEKYVERLQNFILKNVKDMRNTDTLTG